MNRPVRRSRASGFTLVEIAVVLVIVGLITAGIAAMLTTFLKSTRAKVAGDNSAIVQQALQRFIERYGRLPCPAVPTLAPGAANYGTEDVAGCTTPPVPVGATGMARGVVPWISLGLPLDQVRDGYSRMFTYNVTITATQTNAANVSATRGNMTIHTATPTVTGLNAPGNQINSCWIGAAPAPAGENSCNMNAVVVLISHGENGAGAFTSTGGQLPVSTVPAEIENTNADVAFVKGDPTAGGYDDVVFAWSPDDLLEPLARQGTIKSATAVTNETLRNTALAISTAILNAATNCANPGPPCGPGPGPPFLAPNWPTAPIPAAPLLPPPPCQTVQGVALPTDAWGTCLVYAVVSPPGSINICGTTNGAFTLTSAGIDGQIFVAPPTNPNTNRNDDFVITVTVDQIRSQLGTRFGAC
jgi:prepilin-type N-terminal cleavage/methylation domain-containing protein